MAKLELSSSFAISEGIFSLNSSCSPVDTVACVNASPCISVVSWASTYAANANVSQ